MKPKREQKTVHRAPASLEVRNPWTVRAALFAIVLAAYSDSFGLGLAQDSFAIITGDTRIREVTLENLKLILAKDYWWPKAADWLYRPVTTASFLMNYAAFGNGANPAGYHCINFLLHLLNVWLVYDLALLLLHRIGPAFFAAGLWAVHPIGVESVANIVGRADLMAAASVLGGLLLHARSVVEPNWRTIVALFTIALLGAFSKESAAVLIGLMLLWDLSFRQAEIPRRLPSYAAVAVSLGALWFVRRSVFAELPRPQLVYLDNMMLAADFVTSRLTAIKIVGLNLWLLLFPVQLASDRSYNQIPLSSVSDPWMWLSAAVVVAILAMALMRRRQYPMMFFLAGFFGITLLPTSNLVFLIKSIMAERFLYLPAVAFAIAVAALAYHLSHRRAAAVLGVLVALCAVRTFSRNLDWKDNLTLATADVGTVPNSFRLHDTLAKSLFQQDAQRNIDRSIQGQEKAWSIIASLPAERSSELTVANLGIYYAVKGSFLGSPATAQSRPWYEKAVATLRRAREISQVSEKTFDQEQLARGKPLSVRVGFALLYFYLADAYLNLSRYGDAIEALGEGLNINPRFLDGYDSTASAYLALGKPDQAVLAMLKKAQLDGFSHSTLGSVRAVYGKIPDGTCAVTVRNGMMLLDFTCPRLRSDFCAASAGLARSFIEARDRNTAEVIRDASKSHGCTAIVNR